MERRNQVINVTNLEFNLTLTPTHIQIGCHNKTVEDWFDVTEQEAKEMGLKDYDTMLALVQVLMPKVLED